MSILKTKLEQLSNISSDICISISYPTHRTFPDNKQDKLLLKKLIKEAQENVINRFGKRKSAKTVERLSETFEKVNENYNLDSNHIFISEEITEIIQLPVTIKNSEVIINNRFDLHYIIDAINNSKEYLILVLSQSGVQLFNAINDTIIKEIQTNNFPYTSNPHYITEAEKASDSKKVDNLVREYFNKIDKSLQKVSKETGEKVVVVCTPRNYQHLLTVADKSSVYLGNCAINYNDISLHNLSKQAWELINN